MKNLIAALLITALLPSCNPEPSAKITGTYVRERSWEQKNINSGKVIGTTYFRDTILITKKSEGYQLDNIVWRENDYDHEGWQRKFDGTIKTHIVMFDKIDNSLNTDMSFYNPMYLDFENGLLYYDKASENKWKKIKH